MIPRGMANPAVWVIAAILSTSALGFTWVINAYGIHLRKLPIQAEGGRLVSAIPTESEHWIRVGRDRIEAPEIESELGTTNYLTRTYVRKDTIGSDRPVTVEVHIAYYSGQIDTVPHVPERCFVGGGLTIGSASGVYPIPLDDSDWVEDTSAPEGMGRIVTTRLSNRFSDLPGARVRLPADPHNLRFLVTQFTGRGSDPFHVGYFFIANGRTVASAEGVRTLAFNLTDDYAYYCKVQFMSPNARNPRELAELAGSFLDDMYGEIARVIPDWVEVQLGNYPPDNPRRRVASNP